MLHLVLPFALAAVLTACGVYGILARRNAILMLIGVELVLAAAGLILVTMSATLPDRDLAGQILTIFVITLAAAEVCLALGVILASQRLRGHIDLSERLQDDAAHLHERDIDEEPDTPEEPRAPGASDVRPASTTPEPQEAS